MPSTKTNRDYSEKIKQITQNIRNTRESKHYSQEYMARRMGVSQNAYSKIELLNSKLTVSRLIDIANILEVPLVELIEPYIGLTKDRLIYNPKYAQQ